jgi:putative dimethyl sulfoxide reductase chaperone
MNMAQKISMDVDEHTKLRKKGDCYRLLAGCFYQPDKTLLIQEKLFHSLEGLLNDVCPAAAPFAAEMDKALNQISEGDLALEYAQLFVGPFELEAAPYGSVYMDKDRKVMGDSTIEVTKFYNETGLSISDEFPELPDHITAELEFMYYLIFKELKCSGRLETHEAAEYRKKRIIFLRSYPGKWVHLFCERIKAGSQNAFYVALAECLVTFIREALEEDFNLELAGA